MFTTFLRPLLAHLKHLPSSPRMPLAVIPAHRVDAAAAAAPPRAIDDVLMTRMVLMTNSPAVASSTSNLVAPSILAWWVNTNAVW